MNALVVFSAVVCAANAAVIAPYAGAYAAAPYGYAGYAAAPYAAYAAAPYAAKAYAAPYAYAAAPYAYPSSQYQAQDEFGNLNYGYANINSAKQEVGNAYGGVAGSYSYVDANGEIQRVDYVADALGFRVKGTNLPVAPAVPDYPALEAPVFDLEAPVFDGVAPEPVQDTPEVAEAKAAFLKAFEEAKKQKRSADDTPADTERLEKVDLKIKDLTYAIPARTYGYGYAGALPYAAGYGLPYAAGYAGYAGYPYAAGLGYAGLGYGYPYLY